MHYSVREPVQQPRDSSVEWSGRLRHVRELAYMCYGTFALPSEQVDNSGEECTAQRLAI